MNRTEPTISQALIATLRDQLDRQCFHDFAPRYLEEPRGMIKGRAGLILAPATTSEVQKIIRACNQHQAPVIPYGGGTGLVGGQVSGDHPNAVLLSMERMNRIRSLSPDDNILIAEAGVILASIQDAAEQADRLFPLSLASEGSCQIGGNLSTNAGGVGVLRYGNARDLCLGLEAVLPNGEVWNGLSRLRKDNTGYDLKNLLIGAEGSLGIITAASLKLFPRPTRYHAALVQLRDPNAALTLLTRCQAGLAGMVSAFELIHRQGLEFLAEKLPQIRVPVMGSGDWYALIDLGVVGDVHLADRFETLLGNALEDGLISDALIAQNAAQRQEFWTVRETIPEANRLIGAIYSHDISVPVSRIPDLIKSGQALIKTIGDFRINCFGHVGDGNLHYNFYPPKGKNRADYLHLQAPIKEAIYGLVYELGGSMSAEHGIGRMKLADLQRYGDPAKLAAMRAIKTALDPVGILNPGAVVDFGAGGGTGG